MGGKKDLTSKENVAKGQEVYDRIPAITSKPGEVSKELGKAYGKKAG